MVGITFRKQIRYHLIYDSATHSVGSGFFLFCAFGWLVRAMFVFRSITIESRDKYYSYLVCSYTISGKTTVNDSAR